MTTASDPLTDLLLLLLWVLGLGATLTLGALTVALYDHIEAARRTRRLAKLNRLPRSLSK